MVSLPAAGHVSSTHPAVLFYDQFGLQPSFHEHAVNQLLAISPELL